MADAMYPPTTREIAQQRRDLAPETQAAFDAFSRKGSPRARSPRR